MWFTCSAALAELLSVWGWQHLPPEWGKECHSLFFYEAYPRGELLWWCQSRLPGGIVLHLCSSTSSINQRLLVCSSPLWSRHLWSTTSLFLELLNKSSLWGCRQALLFVCIWLSRRRNTFSMMLIAYAFESVPWKSCFGSEHAQKAGKSLSSYREKMLGALHL